MRIAIDARMIRPGSMHGIARYVFELLKGLSHTEHRHEILALISRDSPLIAEPFAAKLKLIPARTDWIGLGEQVELPYLLSRTKADLFHSPSFVAPILVPCQLVMTIHDLNHLVLPQFYTRFHQFYYQVIVRNSIKRSKSILTVSEFSKREIIKNLHLSESKIFVTYNGVAPEYRPVLDREYREYVREIYSLPERFIFCVSNSKPHKNLHQLVRAYCFSGLTIPLVLATPVSRALIQISENYGKKHLVHFTRFIAEEHLPVLYSMTDLFVYPSTYEGFGLPPLEALACGVPVVVSRSSSLPEIVGDQAIFANPFDYREIAKALRQGLEDKELRKKLSRGGIAQAKLFNWQSMVLDTLKVYESCAR